MLLVNVPMDIGNFMFICLPSYISGKPTMGIVNAIPPGKPTTLTKVIFSVQKEPEFGLLNLRK